MDSQESRVAKIWSVAADRLMEQNKHLYRQWFRKITPLAVEGATLKLGVSDDFFASIIEDQYDDLILEALAGIGGVSYSYELEPGHEPVLEENIRPAAENEKAQAAAEPVRPRSAEHKNTSAPISLESAQCRRAADRRRPDALRKDADAGRILQRLQHALQPAQADRADF